MWFTQLCPQTENIKRLRKEQTDSAISILPPTSGYESPQRVENIALGHPMGNGVQLNSPSL